MKFKIGDKVRVVKVNAPFTDIQKDCIGKVFTIEDVCKESIYPYALKGYNRCAWCNEELELVEPALAFTKSDLKDGMVVEFQNGHKAMVVGDVFMGTHCYSKMNNWSDTLENSHTPFRAITKVYTSKGLSLSSYFNDDKLTLIWERPKEEESAKKMTVTEIEKELGYKVEIVSEN